MSLPIRALRQERLEPRLQRGGRGHHLARHGVDAQAGDGGGGERLAGGGGEDVLVEDALRVARAQGERIIKVHKSGAPQRTLRVSGQAQQMRQAAAAATEQEPLLLR